MVIMMIMISRIRRTREKYEFLGDSGFVPWDVTPCSQVERLSVSEE
jgi:hypothetical protein